MPLAADRASISVAPVRFRRNRWLARRHSGIPTCMLLRAIVVAICGLALVLAGAAEHAQVGGNLTAGPPLDIHLEIATGSDGPVLSTTAFDLVTGEYYRLNVTSDGVEPWRLEVDELLRNSHLRLVTINGIEVHLQALAFRAIEFDVAGTAQFGFTPIRTGELEFTVGDVPSVRRRRADVRPEPLRPVQNARDAGRHEPRLLQPQVPDPADVRPRRDPGGDDPRRADHLAGRTRAPAVADRPVAGRFARPLGGRHAGGRDDNLTPRGERGASVTAERQKGSQ